MRDSMIVATLVVAGALGFGLAAQAQQAPREHSMTGCLAKGASADSFKLTDVSLVNANPAPPAVKEVVIDESTANLAPHVGHKVEITGTSVAGKEVHTMKITAVKMVAATCP